jgi:hypothetical protein
MPESGGLSKEEGKARWRCSTGAFRAATHIAHGAGAACAQCSFYAVNSMPYLDAVVKIVTEKSLL